MRYMHIQVCGLPRLGSIVSHQKFNLNPQHSLQLAALAVLAISAGFGFLQRTKPCLWL